MLSENHVELHTNYKISISAHSKKLIHNLFPKRKYLVHYLSLPFYLEDGMQLLEVPKAFRFHYALWLAPYIEKNSMLHAAPKTEFEKDV